jgi:hypothetical protein
VRTPPMRYLTPCSFNVTWYSGIHLKFTQEGDYTCILLLQHCVDRNGMHGSSLAILNHICTPIRPLHAIREHKLMLGWNLSVWRFANSRMLRCMGWNAGCRWGLEFHHLKLLIVLPDAMRTTSSAIVLKGTCPVGWNSQASSSTNF